MNWQEVLLSVLGVALTALLSWLGQRITVWVNSKIKNTKTQSYLTSAIDAVVRSVKMTYQTYVEGLKGKDMFTSDAQLQALKMARDAAISQLSDEVKNFVQQNFGDLEAWVNSTIEATIYDLKNGTGGGEVTTDEGN